MNVRDRVSLTDSSGTHYGKVTGRHNDGVCFVKWDSGTTEKVHEDELTLVEDEKVIPPLTAEDWDEAEVIDGGAPGWREKLVKLWARLGT